MRVRRASDETKTPSTLPSAQPSPVSLRSPPCSRKRERGFRSGYFYASPLYLKTASARNSLTGRTEYRIPPYPNCEVVMAHTVREKQKLLNRVRRIRGQVEAIERALDGEAGCQQIMHLIAGARGAMAGLMAEVVEDHVRSHLVDAQRHPGALNTDAAEQLLDVVRTYLK